MITRSTFKIVHRYTRFSNELAQAKAQYHSNPTGYTNYRLVKQLLRQNKNQQAYSQSRKWVEYYLPDKYKPKMEQLQELARIRTGHTDGFYAQSPRIGVAQRIWMYIRIASLMYLTYVAYNLIVSYRSFTKKSANPGKNSIGDMMSMFDTAKSTNEIKPSNVKFADICGIDQFKEQLLDVVDLIKNADKYKQSGAKLPKGILMVGPPGTGKTMMAKALANQAGCAFLYRNGSEFQEMFVGMGAKRVRSLFEQARRKAPAIIFIDEIDTFAGNRSNNIRAYQNATINQFLIEMDGFKENDNIIVIGATNFEKVIDPALKRAGRFDKILHVPTPDIKGRAQIFQYYLKRISYEGTTAAELARKSTGFSGAEIQNIVNLAILNAVKNSRNVATEQDFEFAHDRVVMGTGRKNLFVSEKDKLITAYHEGGHTLVSLFTEGSMPLHKVTILPRGGALGFTAYLPQTDTLSMTKRQMIARIDACFGGKVAEEIFIGEKEVTSGSSNDLMQATNIATEFVKTYGMNEKLTLISQSNKIQTSQQYTYNLDKEIENMLQESYLRVKSLLHKHKDDLSLLAKELLVKETMTEKQVKQLLKI